MKKPIRKDTSATLIKRGTTFFQAGEHYLAQINFSEAVVLMPDNEDYKSLLIQSLMLVPCPHHSKHIEDALSICLDDRNIRHLPLFPAWHVMVTHSPARVLFPKLQDCESYEDFTRELLLHDFLSPINGRFVCLGLRMLLMKNYGFERVLTYFRRYFLCDASPEELQSAAPFLTALATQCFLNEYLFYISPEEHEKVSELKAHSKDLNSIKALLYACYHPLYQASESNALEDTLHQSGFANIEDLIRIQISEPLEEERLKAQIESFSPINDDISKAVQEQYEEHPFPRWIACGSIRQEQQKALSTDKNILIAGCGTGQQAVIAAINFPHAHITAIDLSRTSLGYAKRKAQHYELKNLTFMHGDILEVRALEQDFDYITCGGVLHHMKDPQAGLKALKTVLKPDGVMRIALYSELARRNIVRIQNWIQSREIPSTLEGIRDFRETFIGGGYKELFDEELPYFDCFSISETRDLFFHVQEHRFTCLSLKKLLHNLSLQLLIFAPEEANMHQGYSQLFPEDPTATNLENWDEIEQEHPDLFLGMYKLYICNEGQHQPGSIPEWLRI